MNQKKCLRIVPLALGVLAFGSVQAQEELVGTWVLDPARSTAPPGMAATGGTMEITDAGGGKYKSVNQAVVGGVTVRTEVTYSVDGQDYAIAATPAQPGMTMTQSVERESDAVYKANVKINGQLMATGVTEISADGKTLTQTSTGVGQFAAFSSTTVFTRN